MSKKLWKIVKENAIQFPGCVLGGFVGGALVKYSFNEPVKYPLLFSAIATGVVDLWNYGVNKKTQKEVLRDDIGTFAGYTLGIYLSYLL